MLNERDPCGTALLLAAAAKAAAKAARARVLPLYASSMHVCPLLTRALWLSVYCCYGVQSTGWLFSLFLLLRQGRGGDVTVSI